MSLRAIVTKVTCTNCGAAIQTQIEGRVSTLDEFVDVVSAQLESQHHVCPATGQDMTLAEMVDA
jgi:hypothetical protein